MKTKDLTPSEKKDFEDRYVFYKERFYRSTDAAIASETAHARLMYENAVTTYTAYILKYYAKLEALRDIAAERKEALEKSHD